MSEAYGLFGAADLSSSIGMRSVEDGVTSWRASCKESITLNPPPTYQALHEDYTGTLLRLHLGGEDRMYGLEHNEQVIINFGLGPDR